MRMIVAQILTYIPGDSQLGLVAQARRGGETSDP